MKKELRAAMKRRNTALTPAERAAASAEIFACLEQLPEFAAAQTVALFCALADEPTTDEVLARWSARKKIVLPRVEGEVMRFYYYDPAVMCFGAFGIAEPGADACLCDPGQIDLIVVPGVSFTPGGDRLGRGRGYYDKYLAGLRICKIGVCYAHQLVDALPAEPHDVRMDRIVTG